MEIDYATLIAEKTRRSASPLRPVVIEDRAADIAKRYSLPMLRAWAATYVAGSAEERETASTAMRAESRDSRLGPDARERLRAEVIEIHRRAIERQN